MKLRILTLIALLLCLQQELFASPKIEHSPPVFEFNKKLTLRISGQDIKRARVLISDIDGIRVKRLSQEGESFAVETDFLNLAILKYQFQVEFASNELYLSDYYYIRQPSNSELEGRISTLNDELNTVQLNIRRLENSISNLKNIDRAVFQQKKADELGKALVALRKKEKEKDTSTSEADATLKAWNNELASTQRGRQISELRSTTELEYESLWKRTLK